MPNSLSFLGRYETLFILPVFKQQLSKAKHEPTCLIYYFSKPQLILRARLPLARLREKDETHRRFYISEYCFYSGIGKTKTVSEHFLLLCSYHIIVTNLRSPPSQVNKIS